MLFEKDRDAFACGITAVENKFILDYLPMANGDHVRVYLWGLMIRERQDADYSLEDMARDLNMTVSEIEAAYRYWERRGIVTKMSDHPPVYRYRSVFSASDTPISTNDGYIEFTENIYAAFGDRRHVTPSEIALAWEWVEEMKLPAEVVIMLINYCMAERGVQFSFKTAEKLAAQMKEMQVSDCDEAALFLSHDRSVHAGVRRVIARMGKRRQPSEDEIRLYEKWLDEWGFTPDAIENACAEMTRGDPNFQYLDAILSSLRKRSNAKTGDQVTKQLEEDQAEAEKAKEVLGHLKHRIALPAALRIYKEWRSSYSHEMLLETALHFERQREGGSLDDFDSMLRMWQSLGIQNEDQLREYLERCQRCNTILRQVFEACGHKGPITEADRKALEKWQNRGMDASLILAAAEQARGAQGNKLAYLSKVLEAWSAAGIADVSQVSEGPRTAKEKKNDRFGDYEQRSYTEDQIKAVSIDLIEEARRMYGQQDHE